MPVQPTGLSSRGGAILTIGVVSESERSSVVIPFCTDAPEPEKATICLDLVTSFQSGSLAAFLDMLSSSAYVNFMSAEGMEDGFIPYRIDFAPTDNPGTRAAVCLPNQVAGLIVFYEDPSDADPGARMRVGKNFIPGLSVDDFSTGALASTLVAAMTTFAGGIQSGFPSTNFDTFNWYRVLAAAKPRGPSIDCNRTVFGYARGYTATQRRRLLPH